MKNVVLIGFMGTGKTSVGRLLATRLGCAFHDLDKKDAENVALLRANGILVALAADVDTILQRTQTRGKRPVLDGADAGDRRAAVARLLEERRHLYESADITVDTSGRAPLEVAEHIMQALRIWRK